MRQRSSRTEHGIPGSGVVDCSDTRCSTVAVTLPRGELSYLAPLGSENISVPYFKPPSPKTEITNILFYIFNFASIIKFKM